MCGIVGYTGAKPALPILLDGLRALEYRGYDSAGVALAYGTRLKIVKRAGKISELVQATDEISSDSTCGIGHTRWATCGPPNEQNAHPHRDCGSRIAVVHNGIIENHFELRDRLEAEGHGFVSQTDTECLSHLIESHLTPQTSLLEATRKALSEVKGSYAIAVTSSLFPNLLVAARVDCPLIIGLGEGENFVASDVVAMLPYTRTMAPLEEGDLAEITSSGISIVDANGADKVPEQIQIDWDVEAAEKGGYEHFMLKEIFEQPAAIRDTLRGRLDRAGRLIMDELRMSDDEVRSIDKVFVVACGSSFHAGLVAKYAIEHWTRLPVEIEVASEFRYRDPVLDTTTLVVGISQSGETADTMAAVRYARRQKAKVVAITNAVGSSITREADAVLYTHAGPEVGVAATKTLTSQMTGLWLLALWMAQIIGLEYPYESKQRVGQLQAIPSHLETSLKLNDQIKEAAEKHNKSPTFLFIGRGVGYPVALEGALKLKEISYLHAEGFPAGEMKHGPIALIEPGVTVVAVASRSHTHSKLLSNIEEAKARGADVIAIANPGDDAVKSLADTVLEVPETIELLSPIIDVIPLQLFAYHIATLRGLDPDKPRNLAKSVTVE